MCFCCLPVARVFLVFSSGIIKSEALFFVVEHTCFCVVVCLFFVIFNTSQFVRICHLDGVLDRP